MTKTVVCNLVFFVEGSRVLLAMKKRGFGKGKWNGVGGKVEPGESIEQSMVREAQEEIGVKPLKWEKVAFHDLTNYRDGTDPIRIQGHTFLCHKWQGKPVETEEMAPHWFDINDLPYDEMWQDDPVWFPHVFAGNKVRTAFEFDNDDNMISAHVDIVKNL
jgi:8-oxo-dGTP pyrophosphatase MutT (NUDIX family)